MRGGDHSDIDPSIRILDTHSITFEYHSRGNSAAVTRFALTSGLAPFCILTRDVIHRISQYISERRVLSMRSLMPIIV
jgi:hypothetical protein